MLELAHTYPMPVAVRVLRHLSRVLARTMGVSAVLLGAGFVVSVGLDNGIFGPQSMARGALQRYVSNWTLVAGVGGILGVGLLLVPIRYTQHTVQRRALNRIAADEANMQVPVAWQRAALSGKRASSVMMWLGIPLLAFFGLISPVAWTVWRDDPHIGSIIVFVGSVVLAFLGLVMTVAGARKTDGPARRRWGDARRRLHPYEDAARKKGPAPVSGAASLHALARLDSWADWLHLIATIAYGAALIAAVGTWFARSCDDGTCRDYSPVVETLLDGLLILSIGSLVLAFLSLAAAAVPSVMVSLRQRPTMIQIAADPASTMPPWPLLRQVILEEAPAQTALGWLHTGAITVLAVGVAGLRTGPEYPISDLYPAFPLLTTTAGVLLLFHTSGWFWRRARTMAENEALLARWPAPKAPPSGT